MELLAFEKNKIQQGLTGQATTANVEAWQNAFKPTTFWIVPRRLRRPSHDSEIFRVNDGWQTKLQQLEGLHCMDRHIHPESGQTGCGCLWPLNGTCLSNGCRAQVEHSPDENKCLKEPLLFFLAALLSHNQGSAKCSAKSRPIPPSGPRPPNQTQGYQAS